MLPFHNRLPKQNVSEVMRHGHQVAAEEIALRYIKTDSLPRFTFVVSTKIDTRATKRNRIRRILSESVRHIIPRLAAADGVFVVRKNIAERSREDTEKIVTEIFRQAGLL